MAAAGLPVRRVPRGRRVTAGLASLRTSAFPASGLVPAIVQDAADGRVLMLAWVDAEALAATVDDRRGPLPLALARPALAQGRDERPHAARRRAGRRLRRRRAAASRSTRTARPAIATRAAASMPTARPPTRPPRDSPGSRRCGRRSPTAPPTRPAGSYTTSLLDGGVDAAARKVTEEATEVLIAAKDDAAAEAAGADRTGDPRGAGRRGGRPAVPRPRAARRARPATRRGHRHAPGAATPADGRARVAAPDLAPALADPDVEPLPGDGFRDERRVRDAFAVDRHAAARDHPPRLAARCEHAGLGQQDRRALGHGRRART